jgi:hypothetical protein
MRQQGPPSSVRMRTAQCTAPGLTYEGPADKGRIRHSRSFVTHVVTHVLLM